MSRSSLCAGYARVGTLALALLAGLFSTARAQDLDTIAPEALPAHADGAPPLSYDYNRSFYNPQLDAHLRVRYHTQSYGQNEGNFDIGTMKLFDLGDAAGFIDGQVTMNEVEHVGYNLGIGYRWLDNTPRAWSVEAERLLGVSLWSDGSTTINENFISQIGLSFESLGDMWDFRGNLYIPLGSETRQGARIGTGEIGYFGNFLSQATIRSIDTPLTVGELEGARRIGDREAWAFATMYGLTGEDTDSMGVKAGLRGYATPDLMLQMAVTHDEVFDTNAVFSLAWFIGRTRTNYRYTNTLADRLREPVLRNDYVAVAQSSVSAGDRAFTDAQGEALRFIHVSDAPGGGGSGTFEDPYRSLASVNGGSQDGDIILVHGGSTFTDSQIVLRDRQRLLGEGNNVMHTVVTSEMGMLALPETSLGARGFASPTIIQTGATTSITLARANEVNNFNIEGGLTAIDGTTLTSNPTLRNLNISDTTGDAITLQAFARNDATDEDNDGNTTEIEFNVTIANVTLDNIGGDGIRIDADAGVNVTAPGTQLAEAISITDVTSTNGTGVGIRLLNTHAGTGASRTTTINRVELDGNSTGLYIEDARGIVNVNNMTVSNTTGDAVTVINSGNVNFNTLEIENAGGVALGLLHDDDQVYSVQWNGGGITGAAGRGIDALGQGSGEFNLQVLNADITGTTGEGFYADISGGTGDADIEFNNSSIIVGNNTAFQLVAGQIAASSVNFRLFNNDITSSGGTTVDIGVEGLAQLNATIQSNDIANSGIGNQFVMETRTVNSGALLFLDGNTANNGSGSFELVLSAGTFRLYDSTDTLNGDNNNGDVNNPGGGITNSDTLPPLPNFTGQ